MIAGGQTPPTPKAVADLKTNFCGGDANCEAAITKTQTDYLIPDPVPVEVWEQGYKPIKEFCGYQTGVADKYRETTAAARAACTIDVLNHLSNYPDGTSKVFTPIGRRTRPYTSVMAGDPKSAFEKWKREHTPPPPPPPVTIPEPEFDEAGKRKVDAFVSDSKAEEEKVSGSAHLEVTPGGKGTGFDAGFAINNPLAHGSNYKLSFHGGLDVIRFHVMSADPQVSLLQSYYGGDWWTVPEFYLTGSMPIGGTFTTVSTVNLMEANPVASAAEGAVIGRLGKEAGAVYLNSILRPAMAGASQDKAPETFSDVLTNVIPFDRYLKKENLEEGDAKSLADIFKSSPAAVIDFLSLRSGATGTEVYHVLKALNFDLNGSDRTAEFKKVVATANRLTHTYKAPEKTTTDVAFGAEVVTVDQQFSLLSQNYKKALAKHEQVILKQTGASKEELKSKASAAKVDYPFENVPDNLWAAQARTIRFEKAVLNKSYVQKPKATLKADFGNIDADYYILTRFGLRPAIEYQVTENLKLKGHLFIGKGDSNPVNYSEGSKSTFADGGMTYKNFGLDGEWQAYQNKDKTVTVPLEGALTYASRGSEMKGYPDFLGTHLKLSSAFVMSETKEEEDQTKEKWTLTPSVGWDGRFDTANERSRNFLNAAVKVDRFMKGEKDEDNRTISLEAKVIRKFGTHGGDYTPVTSSSPFNDSASGMTPGDSFRRIIAGANGWDLVLKLGYGPANGSWKWWLAGSWDQICNYTDTGVDSGQSGCISDKHVIAGASSKF